MKDLIINKIKRLYEEEVSLSHDEENYLIYDWLEEDYYRKYRYNIGEIEVGVERYYSDDTIRQVHIKVCNIGIREHLSKEDVIQIGELIKVMHQDKEKEEGIRISKRVKEYLEE